MQPDATITVLIVDDDLYVRESLSDYLAAAADLQLVGACPDGAAAVAAVRVHLPDVVLMDIYMPGMAGPAATRAILHDAPATRVLALTSFDDDEAVADMFTSGACGFLLKSTRPRALADAIRAAHAGLSLIPPDTILRWSNTRAKPVGPALTERERQALTGLGQGLTNRDIARTMFVSPSTVKALVSSLMRKLDAPTRTGVVARAHALGLLEEDHPESGLGRRPQPP